MLVRRALGLALLLLLALAGPAGAQTWPMGRFGGTPTIASGCGSGSSLTGFDSGGIVTLGSGAITNCVINFSVTYGTALRCVVSTAGIAVATSLTLSTSQLTATAVMTGGTSLLWFCFTP